MSFTSRILATGVAALIASAALAHDTTQSVSVKGIEVHDAYARSASEMAPTGAAFMIIHNHGGPDDRLIAATSDAAARVELHTHEEDANGIMRMIHVEQGLDLPTDGEIVMARGGHHVMFMGLTQPFKQGDLIDLTLVFETAGEVAIQVPVDLGRMPDAAAHGDHGHDHDDNHSHGAPKQD